MLDVTRKAQNINGLLMDWACDEKRRRGARFNVKSWGGDVREDDGARKRVEEARMYGRCSTVAPDGTGHFRLRPDERVGDGDGPDDVGR